jgi:purine-cytosine permease-like protein
VCIHIEARSRNHCCRGKTKIITYSVCLSVALGIQHANSLRHIVISGVSVSTVLFTHCLVNSTTYVKRYLLNTKCAFRFSLQLFFETFLITRRSETYVYPHIHRSTYRVPIILTGSSYDLNFLDLFSKNIHISNFMKIRPVGAEFVKCGEKDRLTEMTKLSRFSKFGERV